MTTATEPMDFVDTTAQMYGGQQEYDLTMLRQRLAETERVRQGCEAAAAALEQELGFLDANPPGSELEAGHYYMRPQVVEKLARARQRLERAEQTVEATRQAVEAADRALHPPRPSEVERMLERARAQLAEVERRAERLPAEIEAARQRAAEQRELATAATDPVKAARRTVAAANAEEYAAKLEAERAGLAAEVELYRGYAALRETQARGAGDTEVAAAEVRIAAAAEALEGVTTDG